MLPPAVTMRLPPPIVLTVGLSVLALVKYHVVGRDTAKFVIFPPADTDTLPPTLITPWSNAPKLIDVCTVCIVGLVSPTKPVRLPVCIHSHQNWLLALAEPLVTSTPVMLLPALIDTSPPPFGLTAAVARISKAPNAGLPETMLLEFPCGAPAAGAP